MRYLSFDGEKWSAHNGSLVDGEKYRIQNGVNGYIEFTHSTSAINISWRNSEIERIKGSDVYSNNDHPEHDETVKYLKSLLEYDGIGDRPTK